MKVRDPERKCVRIVVTNGFGSYSRWISRHAILVLQAVHAAIGSRSSRSGRHVVCGRSSRREAPVLALRCRLSAVIIISQMRVVCPFVGYKH